MTAADNPLYSVVITTYRRPRAVLQTVLSVLSQETPPEFELIVVDNDPQGSALKSLRKLIEGADVPVSIVHERRIGIAVARNRGFAAASGSFVAFLDDDQIASPRWLHHLARIQGSTDADVVFGAVHTQVESAVGHRWFFEDFFARDPDHNDGVIDEIYGCTCALFRRSALGDSKPFCEDNPDCGGALEPLFDRVRDERRTVSWAAGAWAWRVPGSAELSMMYALRSAYNQGRAKTAHTLRAGSRKVVAAAASCVSGLGQTVMYAPVSIVLFVARSKRRGYAYRRFAEGVGRLFWASAFRLRGPDPELIPVAP